jgi:hypothetical protein
MKILLLRRPFLEYMGVSLSFAQSNHHLSPPSASLRRPPPPSPLPASASPSFPRPHPHRGGGLPARLHLDLLGARRKQRREPCEPPPRRRMAACTTSSFCVHRRRRSRAARPPGTVAPVDGEPRRTRAQWRQLDLLRRCSPPSSAAGSSDLKRAAQIQGTGNLLLPRGVGRWRAAAAECPDGGEP